MSARPSGAQLKSLQREILLGFWKVHILYHARTEPVVGQWILTELRRHGYDVSPGTLYPLLARMVERGWLSCESDPAEGRRARKHYRLTHEGQLVLRSLCPLIRELYEEVVCGQTPSKVRQSRLKSGERRR